MNGSITRLFVAGLMAGLTVTMLACQTSEPETDPSIEMVATDPTEVPDPLPTTTDASASEVSGEESVTEITEAPEGEPGDEELPEDIPPQAADPDELQAEALELCQSASEFLDRGEIEDAIAALDRAYQLMLELPNNGDTTYLQAKDDIRALVADLIVRSYESQRNVARDPVIAWDLDLPIEDNSHVQSEIKSFTTTEREVFLAAYQRSGRYRPMIEAKLAEAGLPSQLSWLPLVESNFKVRALSRASALGLWQFIASTGQRYGLARDGWIDQRMDPERSTEAAIAYLADLHGMFGDWPKALASYNCGEGRVMRLQRSNPNEYLDFWDLYGLLPRETRRYVPRFFATLAILENPEKYGITLPELDPPVDWNPVTINRSLQLTELDKALGLESGSLHGLNPELRHKATPKGEYELKVPPSVADRVASVIEEIPVWNPPTPQYVTHRVRHGDTLSGIASRYGTSVGAIMRSNNLHSANRIWPGQRLKVPVRGAAAAAPAGASFNAAEGIHTVLRGESLYSIARRYNTTVAKLRRDNNLSSNLIQPGQKLEVRPGSRSDLGRYQVKSGDTMGRIARAHGVNLTNLLAANGMSTRSTIYPGQWLVIPN